MDQRPAKEVFRIPRTLIPCDQALGIFRKPMEGDVSLLRFPTELLEKVLMSRQLSHRDICFFSEVCKIFHRVVDGNKNLWKIKFQQMWPRLTDLYENPQLMDWLQEYKKRLNYSNNVRKLLIIMSPKFYQEDQISYSQLVDFDELIDSIDTGYEFLVDDLLSVILGTVFVNLTDQYYAARVIRFARQKYLTKVYGRMLSGSEEERLLEKGAHLIAQWNQPLVQIRYAKLASQLDDVADQIKEVLRKQNPNHPIFHVSAAELELWKTKNIDENKWSQMDSLQIFSAMREVFFERLRFGGSLDILYYSLDNSYINKVFENRCGTPALASIIYESIARRLGLKCEPVILPGHFLLRWKIQFSDRASPAYYIDVMTDGRLITKEDCPRYTPGRECPLGEKKLAASTFSDVMEHVANIILVAARQRCRERETKYRSALELMHMIAPTNMDSNRFLARFYMMHRMDLGNVSRTLRHVYKTSTGHIREEARNTLQSIRLYENRLKQSVDQHKEWFPKPRSCSIMYAVGLIMQHVPSGQYCVIYGWDPVCSPVNESLDHIVGAEQFSLHQPYYNILVSDGTTRYVPQETLMLSTLPVYIDHSDVGRYFYYLSAPHHYIPNKEEAAVYPYDNPVRTAFASRFR